MAVARTDQSRQGRRRAPRSRAPHDSGQRGGGMALERLIEAFGDLVVIRDFEGRIVEASPSFCDVTGCADPVGRPFLEFCATPEAGDPAADPNRVILETRDGQRTYEWREVVTRDPVSGAAVVHSLGRNVTERQYAGQDLIAGRERAEQANAAKSRFLGMVSHEVRTPLNGILGITQLLARTRLTREQDSYVEAVHQSGHALLSLIEDLLDFSSMEAGRFFLRPEPVDLHALVTGLVELSASRADESGVEIAAHIAPAVPQRVVVDPGRLRQVLFNLVGNALKFTEDGGVFVEVALNGEALEFRVTDSGPGISAADRERIFREFEQVETGPTRRKDGAGLGLAISARLVAAMGGEITIGDGEEPGTTFIVRIPLTPDAQAEAGDDRRDRLAASRVLLVCRPGPTATALVRLIGDEGGQAVAIGSIDKLDAALERLGGMCRLTDVIVDNRIASVAEDAFARFDPATSDSLVRTMMVMPAERDALTKVKARDYSAWLIRPLRPGTVVKVLRREISGIGGWREERRRPDAVDPDAQGRRPAEKTLRILLAEDNPVNALLVRSALQHAGHTVTHVTNGRALVDAACVPARKRRDFDLVLTDLSMPEMDGNAAIAAIRRFEEAESLPPLPIVVLSADGQASTRERAMKLGAQDYVEKPVDPDALLQTVERAVIQSHGQTPARR